MNKSLLAFCLLLGVVLMIGLRGLGWIAHLVVPGLLLGAGLYAVIQIVLWVKK